MLMCSNFLKCANPRSSNVIIDRSIRVDLAMYFYQDRLGYLVEIFMRTYTQISVCSNDQLIIDCRDHLLAKTLGLKDFVLNLYESTC